MSNDKFDFDASIKSFNEMYGLSNKDEPTLIGSERVRNFHNILVEELDEGLELAAKYEAADRAGPMTPETELDLLTEMSDWLGDIIVYVASEARRWGIPTEQVLKIIMASNASKLGLDGKPIYDERGKVMKGPGYWKPEAKIKELLQSISSKK